mgnify:CR=1 FL=1|tara:strand:+ start:99032 stop:100291 length:1260 start_codon:yes stop_codon:yes gene_type:complete
MDGERLFEPRLARRELIALASALPLAPASTAKVNQGTLVAPSEFLFRGINLNGAAHHPMPARTARAISDYALSRSRSEFSPGEQGHLNYANAVQHLGTLLNAKADELMIVPSTSYGESMLLASLGLMEGQGRIVTDVLHWKSSLYQYSVLAKKGLDLVVVPQRAGAIDLNELDKAITPGTRLVAVSLVSYITGFQHDLKALVALAHDRGALIYVDATQAAGAVPIDLTAWGVDYCAGAGYKWLMGDTGAGFFFASASAQRELKRMLCGAHQVAEFSVSVPARGNDAAIDAVAKPGIAGILAIGSISSAAILALSTSLQLLDEIGIERICRHRVPLFEHLERGMAELGYERLTPPASTSPIATYYIENADTLLGPHLKQAEIDVALGRDKMRISPSVYSSLQDIDILLDVMKVLRDQARG